MSAGKVIAGLAAAIVAAESVFSIAANASLKLHRPPGIHAESDFMARCTKCGKCIEACPYATIKAAGPLTGAAAGTPYINERAQACHLCADFPCANACPTGALRDVFDKRDPHMGYACIDEQVCIAYQGNRCEVCYRACPLIDEAITIEFQKRDDDPTHVNFIPTIHQYSCAGCGRCVERCVVSEPYVPIRIVTLAEDDSHKRASRGTGHGRMDGTGNSRRSDDGGKGTRA